jgi:hypothetical protein
MLQKAARISVTNENKIDVTIQSVITITFSTVHKFPSAELKRELEMKVVSCIIRYLIYWSPIFSYVHTGRDIPWLHNSFKHS